MFFICNNKITYENRFLVEVECNINDLMWFSNKTVADLVCKNGYVLTGNNGILKGLNSGEEIKYSIINANNNTTWNMNNQYSLIYTRENQTVLMKAEIKLQENPTHHMTPDKYRDTLTVILTY